MNQPEQPEGKNKRKRSITRRVGILLIVLMAVIACTLFLVIGICSGATMFTSLPNERKSTQLAEATISFVTLRRGSGRNYSWQHIISILTLVGVGACCLWLLV
jgi:predicted PurR-regulated permease PerM